MNVYLDSVGCRLNQSEIEKLGKQFREAGHHLVADASDADLVVVNTCAVTSAAAADSRQKIRSAAKVGKAHIVATGCYATIDPEAIWRLPSVDSLVMNDRKDSLVSDLLKGSGIEKNKIAPRLPLPGEHKRTRAFIKVQEGCDNFCSFCITRIARGKSRSMDKAEIFADIESALLGGVQEVVLTGVNIGAWGRELEPAQTLTSLIKEIVYQYYPPRLRLSSLEPWDLYDDFLEVITLPGFCQHLHLPLQSGSDAILRMMGRRINTSHFRKLLERLRHTFPDISITTDIMVGFPGETDQMFEESMAFIKEMNFSGGHIFTFSPRPGTPAEKFQGRINPSLMKDRSRMMRQILALSAKVYQEKFISRKLRVLWEKAVPDEMGYQLSGLSENYLHVTSVSMENLYNQIGTVIPQLSNGEMLRGAIVNEG